MHHAKTAEDTSMNLHKYTYVVERKKIAPYVTNFQNLVQVLVI